MAACDLAVMVPEGGENRRTTVNLSCKLNTEIQAVVATMRQNAQWADVPQYIDDPEPGDPLLEDFKVLRRSIFAWDWQNIKPSMYLTPFLEVIRSEKTNTPITGVALSAVYKMLSLEFFTETTTDAQSAMHSIIDAVTSCRFEVTDQASEEVVLIKILQVLLACLRCRAGVLLTDRDVCNVVNTCFRVVHQSVTKGELLQRMACHTMLEMVRSIYSRLPFLSASLDEELQEGQNTEGILEVPEEAVDKDPELSSHVMAPELGSNGVPDVAREASGLSEARKPGGNEGHSNQGAGEPAYSKVPGGSANGDPNGEGSPSRHQEEHAGSVHGIGGKGLVGDGGKGVVGRPHGVACMVEIFHFLCSLLSLEDHSVGTSGWGGEEDMPLFALGLINCALELGGDAVAKHPKLLSLVQDDLFRNLMQMGLSQNESVLSLACSVVLNLYHTLRVHLKLQIEAFFSFVVIRLAQGKYGAPYQQQEVAMEAVVDFCRQPAFLIEMYSNYDCDISCSNVFEELASLLSKNAFPVNSPLSTMHVLALEGLLAIIHSMAHRVAEAPFPPPTPNPLPDPSDLPFSPFWSEQSGSYEDPGVWVGFVRRRKGVKKRLAMGAEQFNRDPKKGLLYLTRNCLLPDPVDPHSVACLFRHTQGISKNFLGEYLGEPDKFNMAVLHHFTSLFDFKGLALDGALRAFLESFRLQGEAQKISRVLEAFAERYYHHCPHILANKDVAYILAYSVIMLNTDQHNGQVRQKMTEEEFVRNNRQINDRKDLPREMLTDLYHSIAKNEIRISSESSSGIPEMTYSRWIDLIRCSKTTTPYILCPVLPLLDLDMYMIVAGPAIAAISVVFDHTEEEEVLKTCCQGFLEVGAIAAHYRLEEVIDDLVVALCKFTTLLNPPSGLDEPAVAFGEDTKARLATCTVFKVANTYGDLIRSGWRNIVDCTLMLHRLGLLPAKVSAVMEEGEGGAGGVRGEGGGKPSNAVTLAPPVATGRRRQAGLMSRFSQFLSLDSEEQNAAPTEEQVAAQQRTQRTIQECRIDQVFADSKFLQADSLLCLTRALIGSAGRPQRGGGGGIVGGEDEDAAACCLDLLVAVTLHNRDRIGMLWPAVSEHMAGIVQSATGAGGQLVEKAVFGLLKICRRLLPYKEELAPELLRSLQLIQKLDAGVADALCERITVELKRLVRGNAAHIKSAAGWRTVCALLAITARHVDAGEAGFEALASVMAGGGHMSRANYGPCLDAALGFAEARMGGVERSIAALDLLAGLTDGLQAWAGEEGVSGVGRGEGGAEGEGEGGGERREQQSRDLGDMWLRLSQAVRRVCGDPREDVRNYALMCLQRCMLAGDGMPLPPPVWGQAFDQVLFVMLDDLLEIGVREKPKEWRNMEGSLYQALKLASKVFLHFLPRLTALPGPGFRALWLALVGRMEGYMGARLKGGQEQLQENIPELLKNLLLVMQAKGVLEEETTAGGDTLWEVTWKHVDAIAPGLKSQVLQPPPPPTPPPTPPTQTPPPAPGEAVAATANGGTDANEEGGGGETAVLSESSAQ